MKELTEFIIKSIVNDTENVEVVVDENDKTIVVNIKVSEDDKGKVIGRGGKVINSIKTLLQESSSLTNEKFVKVEVNR